MRPWLRSYRSLRLAGATSILAFFSLACLGEVDGERASTGTCPEGETCSEATPEGLEFVGRIFFDEPILRLGPVLVGGTFELGMRTRDGAPLPALDATGDGIFRVAPGDDVFGPTREDGLPYYPVDGHLELRAVRAGVARVRILDPRTGALFDRLEIEAVMLQDVEVVVAREPERRHLYAGCDEMIGVRLTADNGATEVRGFDEGLRVRADGVELAGEPLFWDCMIHTVPADASEVAFDVDVAGRSFRRTLPVASLGDDGLTECPVAAD